VKIACRRADRNGTLRVELPCRGVLVQDLVEEALGALVLGVLEEVLGGADR
jgi:hypothetical protein